MRIALMSWESLHSIQVGGVGAHVSELAHAPLLPGERGVHIASRIGIVVVEAAGASDARRSR
jgi:hypothetical protein